MISGQMQRSRQDAATVDSCGEWLQNHNGGIGAYRTLHQFERIISRCTFD